MSNLHPSVISVPLQTRPCVFTFMFGGCVEQVPIHIDEMLCMQSLQHRRPILHLNLQGRYLPRTPIEVEVAKPLRSQLCHIIPPRTLATTANLFTRRKGRIHHGVGHGGNLVRFRLVIREHLQVQVHFNFAQCLRWDGDLARARSPRLS